MIKKMNEDKSEGDKRVKLDVITLQEKKKWDSIVSLFSSADVYYLSEYVEAFRLHGDGDPCLFYFLDESSGYKALNVAMKRDIAKNVHFAGKIEENKYFDLATPYGYGGIVFNGGSKQKTFLKSVNETYTQYCNEFNIVSEFVRFHPNIENGPESKGLYDVIQLGETVCLDLRDRELIWENIISKNRNMIRKAQKSAVKIKSELSHQIMQQFIQLYHSTMDRDHADSYYYFGGNFYNSILEDLRNNSTIFYATWEDQIIAASIILFSGNRMHYHLSASNAAFRHLAPTNLLLYEAACWGAENGYKTFHLGGGLGAQNDNLYNFKKAFNKQENTQFWIGKKIFNADLYDYLLKIRKQEINFDDKTGFFPKYRG